MNVSSDLQSSAAQNSAANSLLRVVTAGSVDDGKSTLIGRLLYDSNSICDDHLRSLQNKKGDKAKEGIALAMLTDGLKSEAEQLITIDVAYRFFSTPNRHFILGDAPGHEQYTRNMVTAASTADVIIILIDATKGVLPQTKRHACIGSLMGVPRFLVVVNKMDMVGYDQKVFNKIKDDFFDFSAKLNTKDIRFTPISALVGDNVVSRSTNMDWYSGETVMQYLENVYIGGDKNSLDFRFPVQYVIRPDQQFRGYAGLIASGSIKPNDPVMVLPSRETTTVKSVLVASNPPETLKLTDASVGQSVTLELNDNVDVTRGDMIVRVNNSPRVTNDFEAMMVWMGDEPWDPTRTYLLQHTTRLVKAELTQIRYGIDINTLHRKDLKEVSKNEVFCAKISTRQSLCIDDYRINRATGAFILIDPDDHFTVGVGMVVERQKSGLHDDQDTDGGNKNLHSEIGFVASEARRQRVGHSAFTVWLTGLSGSGKSTIAKSLEETLFKEGYFVYQLDGDNLRQGLNKGLTFSPADRSENIRRAAEVAKILNDAGTSVICAFISPYASDRQSAKEIIGQENFVEVHVEASVETCTKRDPHGLYKKAIAGEIKSFTGISAPYEAPASPSLVVNTEINQLDACIDQLFNFIVKKYQRVGKIS